MTERRIQRRLLRRKDAAARGIKTGTTLAYESVWVVEERAGDTWVEKACLPDEAEARAWSSAPEVASSTCERPEMG